METANGLTRRVAALEQAVGIVEALPCVDCGRAHAFEALSLERISATHLGEDVAVPEICGCACCRPVLRELVGRLTWRDRGAA